MTVAAVMLGLALLASLALHYVQARQHAQVVKDLLSRLMARDYGEYQALVTADRPPMRRKPLTDAQEAAMERWRGKEDKTAQEAALRA